MISLTIAYGSIALVVILGVLVYDFYMDRVKNKRAEQLRVSLQKWLKRYNDHGIRYRSGR